MTFIEVQLESLEILSRIAGQRIEKIRKEREKNTTIYALNIVSSILDDDSKQSTLKTTRTISQKNNKFTNEQGQEIDPLLLKNIFNNLKISCLKTRYRSEDQTQKIKYSCYVDNNEMAIQRTKAGIESLITETKSKMR